MKRSSSRGFTIVELLIVVVVIAILAAITIVSYNGVQAQAKDSRRAQDFSSIKKALLLYNTGHSGVPSTGSYYPGGYPATHSGWDSSTDAQWLSFLRQDYGKMPVDPVNTITSDNNPPGGGNLNYYYYCYTPPNNGYTVPTVVIGYHNNSGAKIQDIFQVDACL